MSALSDLRVLDLAGPIGWYATKLLADLGADVLRIEPPGGDPARGRGPFWRGRSLAWWHFNTSKRSEIVDLASATGRDRFRALAHEADVIVESARPGALEALGIGYRQIAAENPGIVWTAVTPFGQTGPYAQWKGNDLIMQAMGGVMFMVGMPERPPTQIGGNQAEYQAGVLAACGTLIALTGRDRTGRGQLVDISGQAAMALDGENAIPFWDIVGWERPRLGDKNYRGALQVFPAKDGWVMLSMGGRWIEFRDWLEQVGLLTDDLADPKWEENSYRAAHFAELEQLVQELCRRQTRAEIYRLGQTARVGVAPILRVGELFEDPQLNARGYWQAVQHPDFGTVTYPGAPYKLSRTPWQIRRPPEPGECGGVGVCGGGGDGEQANGHSPLSVTAGPRTHSHTPTLPHSRTPAPLSGLRVVDLTWLAAGPLSTRLLAAFGADVLKIESNIHPDGGRNLPAPRPIGNDSPNVSGTWMNYNQGKSSITLDLRFPEAIRQLERLIAIADVLVDNFGVDPLPRWGLTPARLRELNPDLIIARSSVMGRTGPRQHFIGFGYTIAAAAGHNYLTGFPDDPPAGSGIAHPDYTCNPYHLVVAILAALRHRARTGEGQTIDLSQHESTVCWIGPELMDWAMNGVNPTPPANRHPQAAPHGAFPAAGDDRWIAIACETDDEFRALCRAIDRPDLADRYPDLASRKADEDALDAELTRWTRDHDMAEAMRILQSAGVPAGAVLSHRELIEHDPQLLHRAHFRRIEHPEAALRIAESSGIVLSDTPGATARPAPLLGEHNDERLRDLLGLREDEIANGYVAGWIG